MSGQPIFPSYPKPELISCDRGDKGSVIIIKTGEETCIRCRGYGTPRPQVSIYKGADEFATMHGITVFNYVNVVDAGVSEATYLIRNPSSALNGDYSCKATNDKGSNQIPFEIRYKQRKT